VVKETYVHKTRIGALKAKLEWSRVTSHKWLVEGHEIEELGRRVYVFPINGSVDDAVQCRNLTEAFEHVATKMFNDAEVQP
jgi:hypothetical protein